MTEGEPLRLVAVYLTLGQVGDTIKSIRQRVAKIERDDDLTDPQIQAKHHRLKRLMSLYKTASARDYLDDENSGRNKYDRR